MNSTPHRAPARTFQPCKPHLGMRSFPDSDSFRVAQNPPCARCAKTSRLLLFFPARKSGCCYWNYIPINHSLNISFRRGMPL
nr:MAG TPA: hypothetical protein [Caudoviricetes sp.]